MAESLAHQVLQRLDEVGAQYHRLVLLVAPSGSGKTAALRSLADQLGVPILNINLELSRQLLDLAEKQRALRVSRILDQVVKGAERETTHGKLVVLDNIEVLFDVALKQDPLRLLQGLSRNRTVVASWNGTVHDGNLDYAEPGHPEHRRCPSAGLVVVSPAETA